jgi:alkanesulfonate monooxygenase SsuD/methylene tetrahydromethanopterin reductase-like flavin-dependent oxidoreductase (luciferase family)
VHYNGKHFSLNDAILLPRPLRPGGPPLLIGGNGPKRTLPLVAKYADEWNAVYITLVDYKERSAQLNDMLVNQGRKPADVKRSLMTGTVFARSDADLKDALVERSKNAKQEITAESLIERGLIVGTPSMWVDQIGEFAEAGVERFMLQWLDLDDIDGLEIIARDILPHFHN